MPDAAPTQAAPDPDRSAVLADMAAWRAEGGGASAEAKVDEKPTETKVETSAPEAKPETAVEKPAEVKVEPKTEPRDPDMERRHKAIKDAEKASKQAIAQEREQALAAIAEREKASTERLAKADAFEAALKQARRNPVALFERLGFARGDFGAIAQAFHAASDEGQKDPRYKEAADRALREREERDEVATLKRELNEFREAQAQREARASAERDVEIRMGKLVKHARGATDAPLIAKLFEHDADDAERTLAAAALALFEEHGEFPDPEDVIASYEKQERARLARFGVDIDSLTKKTATPTKKPDQIADEQRPARTLPNDPSTSTPVRRGGLSDEEERAEILDEIRRNAHSAAVG